MTLDLGFARFLACSFPISVSVLVEIDLCQILRVLIIMCMHKARLLV
jgi:hypothetical protein